MSKIVVSIVALLSFALLGQAQAYFVWVEAGGPKRESQVTNEDLTPDTNEVQDQEEEGLAEGEEVEE